MRNFAIAALCATFAAAETMPKINHDFLDYISKFGKAYETIEEFVLRQENFA